MGLWCVWKQVAYHVADGTPRVVYGDAQRLQQVLLNILNNGVKFTEVGNEVQHNIKVPSSRGRSSCMPGPHE
jgi:signal transduction histidine kinase